MGFRVGLNSLVKSLVDKGIIIALADHIGHDTPVIEIQNGAQIELVYSNPLIPFELSHIGKPFLIGLCSIELAVQKVLSNMLGILGPPGTATPIVFHSGPNIPGPADTQHSFIIDMDTIVVTQIVIESSVALIWAFLVDLLDPVCQTLVLYSSAARFSQGPFMVGRTGHMEQSASRFNGIPLLLVAFFDCHINMALSYFRETYLLSTWSNFLAGHARFLTDTAYA